MTTSNKWIQKHRLPVKVAAIPEGSPCLGCQQIQYSKDEARAWARCGYLDYGFPYEAEETHPCPHNRQGEK